MPNTNLSCIMRKLTLSQLTTLILMTFLFSCDNQDQLLTTEQPDNIVLAARLWFETEKPKSATLRN
jgi:hypothetical protein